MTADHLQPEVVAARVRRSTVAQGVPEHVADLEVLGRVARLLGRPKDRAT